LGLSTVVDFEKKRRQVSPESVTAIRRALVRAGVEFIDENGGGPGVRLRKGSQKSATSDLPFQRAVEFLDENGGGPGVRLRSD
jgi:hypothetical protein